MKNEKKKEKRNFILSASFLFLLSLSMINISFAKSNASHLAEDLIPMEKNTGNPNTSFLTSEVANNLPVMNHEKGERGCYIACYSHGPGVYQVGDFGVHGLIRVAGHYQHESLTDINNYDPNCYPQVNEESQESKETKIGQNERTVISENRDLKNMCNEHFSACENGCWAGGDTAGFFFRLR